MAAPFIAVAAVSAVGAAHAGSQLGAAEHASNTPGVELHFNGMNQTPVGDLPFHQLVASHPGATRLPLPGHPGQFIRVTRTSAAAIAHRGGLSETITGPTTILYDNGTSRQIGTARTDIRYVLPRSDLQSAVSSARTGAIVWSSGAAASLAAAGLAGAGGLRRGRGRGPDAQPAAFAHHGGQ
jgi:hypothetical protein